MNGIVKVFHFDKGYGFIIPEGKQAREDDKFFHIKECRGFTPEEGDAVTFEIGVGRNDKPCAVNVKLQ